MKKFLLIDDHMIVRSGLKTLLAEIYTPVEIDEAHDGNSAVEKIKENRYDLVIMDVQMPDTDPIGLLQFFLVKRPGIKVLIYSMSSEKIYAKRFLKEGAKGFIRKDSPLTEMIKAIDVILKDRIYVSESLAALFAEETFSGQTENPFNKLSPREFEITSLLLSGQGVGDISKVLHISTSTVGTHKTRLFEKLAVENIIQLKELAVSYNV